MVKYLLLCTLYQSDKSLVWLRHYSDTKPKIKKTLLDFLNFYSLKSCYNRQQYPLMEKEAAIQKALQYRFSSFDVDKILASKEKFSKHPHNYAMTKTKLLKEKGQVC